MTFWQENYSFIREVYDTRYAKMVEWMDNVEMAIQKVCASKVYTSAEFKREKDNFHVCNIFFIKYIKQALLRRRPLGTDEKGLLDCTKENTIRKSPLTQVLNCSCIVDLIRAKYWGIYN